MSLWWPFAMATIWSSQPWDTWFWAQLPETAWGWPGWVYGSQSYWFMKISPSGGHQQQLAIKSPADRTSSAGYLVKKGTIYICCYGNDTPNWGGISSLVSISPPCSNWCTALYQVPEEVTRSQTSGVKVSIQDSREIVPGIRATVAKTDQLADAITASIQAYREEPVTLQVAIKGEVSRNIPIKAAVRKERSLVPGIEAAIAKTDELPITIQVAIQGHTQLPVRTRAAIKGEGQKQVGIIANVVVSRVPQIYLEMENLVPQEFDLRGTPNWPSKVKDWRAESLGQ